MKKNVTMKEKFHYWLDNKLLDGTKSMVYVLLISTLIMILICGVIVAICTDSSMLDGVWKSVTHIFDGGTIGGDEEEPAGYMIPMFIITIFGIVVFSTLVGIINNALESKLSSLEAGNYKIIENDHIIILGFDSEIYSILNELISSNENNIDSSKNGGTIVILDSFLTPQEMRDQVDTHIVDKKNTKIIYRKGIIYNTGNIEKCSANTAKNIIVNIENDSVTLKCVLAANLVLKKYNNTTTKIIASMKEKDNQSAAIKAIGDRLVLLDFDNMIAKMIAQSSRFKGISEVFEEIFSFDGSEFYYEPAPRFLNGENIKKAILYYDNSTVIGKYSSLGKTSLIPTSSKDLKIEEGDKLIFLAEDDSLIKCSEKASEFEEIPGNNVDVNSLGAPSTVLILRYSNKLELVLDELFLISSLTNVTIVLEKSVFSDPNVEKHINYIKDKFVDNKINVIVIDTFGINEIERVVVESNPDSVIVLGNKTGVIEIAADEELMRAQCEREDAQIMFILLLLRSVANDKNYSFTITSELHYCENQKLARDTGVDDFIVGSSIKNMICAQIADDVSRLDLFLDLVTSDGTEISFRYADEIFKVGYTYNVVDIKMYLANRSMVLVGYKHAKNGEERIILNPANSDTVAFNEDDIIILLV